MNIKICGLKELQNIRDVIRLQPDFIGLIFHPGSKRFVGSDPGFFAYVRSIKLVKKVGVFVDEQPDVILDRVAACGLDVVQLHGQESPDVCRQLAARLPVWKAFSMDDQFDFALLSAYQPYCRHFLFDTPSPLYGGSGRPFDWQLLQDKPVPLPFFLSGGISASDAEKIGRFVHPHFEGIDVNSCFELRPGYKDTKLLNTFIHELRH